MWIYIILSNISHENEIWVKVGFNWTSPTPHESQFPINTLWIPPDFLYNKIHYKIFVDITRHQHGSQKVESGQKCIDSLFSDPITVYVFILYMWLNRLTLCMLDNFACFFVACDIFFNFLKKILSEILSECQTVWIQIRPDILSRLIWIQTVCKG